MLFELAIHKDRGHNLRNNNEVIFAIGLVGTEQKFFFQGLS